MQIDRSLARACEFGERDGLRGCIESGIRNFPELELEVRDFAGGILVFAGGDSPLTEAVAVGIDHAVTAADVDEMTEFFTAHACTPRVAVGALTTPDLAPLLARRGYVPARSENLLVAEVERLDGAHHPRITVATDPREWGEASARGFSDDGVAHEALVIAATLIAAGGATVLEVREDGAIVSTAGMAFEEGGGTVALFAASTLPAYRRRGWQRAMIRERIARAREAGMRYARVTAEPLGASERNFRALGFVPLYTRVLWEWRSV